MPLYAPALKVQEADGSPSATPVHSLVVPNTTLTVGGGTATLAASSAGLVVLDEGANIGTATVLNFTGAGGTASFSGGTVTYDVSGGTVATPVFGGTTITSGSYTGAGTAWGTVTGGSVTVTTLARRALVGVICCGQVGTSSDGFALDISVDGVQQGGTAFGLVAARIDNIGHRQNMSFTCPTAVLSAGSHTIGLIARRITGSGTITIFSETDQPLKLWVQETEATA